MEEVTLLYRDTPRPTRWQKFWGAKDLYEEAIQRQGCLIWCTCGVELISSKSHIGSEGDDGAIELFICTQCGEESRWLFDFPAPLRLPIRAQELTAA